VGVRGRAWACAHVRGHVLAVRACAHVLLAALGGVGPLALCRSLVEALDTGLRPRNAVAKNALAFPGRGTEAGLRRTAPF
jgi:hypothetical protein